MHGAASAAAAGTSAAITAAAAGPAATAAAAGTSAGIPAKNKAVLKPKEERDKEAVGEARLLCVLTVSPPTICYCCLACLSKVLHAPAYPRCYKCRAVNLFPPTPLPLPADPERH